MHTESNQILLQVTYTSIYYGFAVWFAGILIKNIDYLAEICMSSVPLQTNPLLICIHYRMNQKNIVCMQSKYCAFNFQEI